MVQGKSTGYFGGLNKTMEKIVKSLLDRDSLCKLLYYDDDDPLSHENLTIEQKLGLRDNKLSIIPSVSFSDEKGSFIIVAFDTFNINNTNPKFIDQTFGLDLYCHKDLWKIKGGKLRPFVILDEIHQVLEDSNMFGIGRVKFMSGGLSLLTEEMMGYVIKYRNIDIDRPSNQR